MNEHNQDRPPACDRIRAAQYVRMSTEGHSQSTRLGFDVVFAGKDLKVTEQRRE
jgi:hypothetical protein